MLANYFEVKLNLQEAHHYDVAIVGLKQPRGGATPLSANLRVSCAIYFELVGVRVGIWVYRPSSLCALFACAQNLMCTVRTGQLRPLLCRWAWYAFTNARHAQPTANVASAWSQAVRWSKQQQPRHGPASRSACCRPPSASALCKRAPHTDDNVACWPYLRLHAAIAGPSAMLSRGTHPAGCSASPWLFYKQG